MNAPDSVTDRPRTAAHPADLMDALHTTVRPLTGVPNPVRYARQTVLDQLAEHIDDPGLLEDLAVMVSEATTNAAIHAPGPCELRIISHGGLPLVIEIADTGDQLDVIAARLAAGAVPDQLGALQDGGRGLGIIARLSGGRCAVQPTRLYSAAADGKSVWFAIPGRAP
ncbi:ATP-binding protein [Streptomyces sp. NPDC001530]|uniref:ATP-binding protein n=1 Tax=Streptomyces sp. NPDC001530 TaxID=3364582 RepID=UPI0036B5DA31